MAESPAGAAFEALLFDGRSAAPRPVRLRIVAGQLFMSGHDIQQVVALSQVQWPEPQRHGQRIAYLPDGALLSSDAGASWDAWAASHGLGASWLVRWMQSWRGVMAALLATVLILGAAYVWGTPLAAQGLLALCPPQVDAQVGEQVLREFDRGWLRPSQLSADRQQALRAQFDGLVQRAPGTGPRRSYRLHFRAAPEEGIGPNAFALPGGHIVATDALVRLLDDRPDALMAVLGHEWGHVQRRHGMRSVVQASLLAGLSAVVVGDVSTALAGAPALLGQLAYSRDFEREADDDAVALMRANGLDPTALAILFERLQQARAGRPGGRFELPIALGTHPPDAERLRRLRSGR